MYGDCVVWWLFLAVNLTSCEMNFPEMEGTPVVTCILRSLIWILRLEDTGLDVILK